MLFNSIEFLLFFSAFFFLYWFVLKKNERKVIKNFLYL